MKGNSTYFGSKVPDRSHLVKPGGGIPNELFDLRQDIDEAFVAIEAALGTTILPEAAGTRYVDLHSTHPNPNGSFTAPYTAIQDAVDDLETIGGWTDASPAHIFVTPGNYLEAVVIRQNGINIVGTIITALGSSKVYIQAPAGQAALTLTNATPESLAAYEASGNYSDLVNQGDAGPRYNSFTGIRFRSLGFTTTHPVRLLGVKGDDGPDKTGFGYFLTFWMSRFFGEQDQSSVYARNMGTLQISDCISFSKIELHNSIGLWAINCLFEGLKSSYDPTDSEGEHSYASVGWAVDRLQDSIMEGWQGHINTIDNRILETPGCEFGARNTAQDTQLINGAVWRMHGTSIRGDVDVGGDCDVLATNSSIDGDLTIGSGAGTVDWVGDGYTGNLTDPDGKLALKPTKRFNYPSTLTGTTTAKIAERLRYDTSGGTFTINAPASPNVGDSFAVKEIAGDATDLTVSGNGINIEHPLTGAVAASATFGQARIGVTWEYDGSNWIAI